jgi:hypothetical protein
MVNGFHFHGLWLHRTGIGMASHQFTDCNTAVTFKMVSYFLNFNSTHQTVTDQQQKPPGNNADRFALVVYNNDGRTGGKFQNAPSGPPLPSTCLCV